MGNLTPNFLYIVALHGTRLDPVLSLDETFSLSPWHGLAIHRPLGSIMRARKEVYKASPGFRASENDQLLVEPRIGGDPTGRSMASALGMTSQVQCRHYIRTSARGPDCGVSFALLHLGMSAALKPKMARP